MKLLLEILQKIPIQLLLFLSALSVVLGDFFAKYWSTNQRKLFFAVALLAYFLSGVLFIPALLKERLVISAMLYTLFSVSGFLFIGLIIFKESLSMLEAVGVVLGIVALIILAVPVK